MGQLRISFPNRKQIFQVFLAIVFPVNFWTLFFFLRELPSYLMRMAVWDILGILAYSLTAALLDSLALITFLIFLSLLIPRKYFRESFAAYGVAFAYLIVFWAMMYHIISTNVSFASSLKWSNSFWLWFVSFLVMTAILYYLLRHFVRFREYIYLYLEKLSSLSYIYLGFNILALAIIFLRTMGVR